MWKIRIVYSDKSKCKLTGKHRDIRWNWPATITMSMLQGSGARLHISSTPKRIMRKWICLRRLKNWNPVGNK
jgi:hypothetical protein